MIVFDVDGTLVGGEPHDWRCFGDAFEQAAGFRLDAAFFGGLEEVTARAIVHQALPDADPQTQRDIEDKTRTGYLRRLQDVHHQDAGAFPASAGAADLLADIQARGLPWAIATGDWYETISFKLQAAGIQTADVPMATSSDHYSRSDILSTAIGRAGGKHEQAVYIGDGVWDLRAARQLGIPFIGCGARRDKLREAGAAHLLDSFHPDHFWPVYDRIQSEKAPAH